MLLWVSCYIFFVEEIEISPKKYKEVFIFTNVLHLAILVVNKFVEANYAFLTEPPIFKKIAYMLPKSIYVAIMLLNFNILLFLVHFYFVKLRSRRFKRKSLKKFKISKKINLI